MSAAVERSPAGKDINRDRSRLIQLTFFVGFMATWWVVTETGLVSPFFLPRPALVLAVLVDIISTGSILPDLMTTTYQLAVAFPIALIAGVSLGYLISMRNYTVDVFEPMLAGLFAVPLIIFYPLNVLILGIGPESKIAHGAIFGFFPIVLSAIQSFGNVDRNYLRASRSMGATRLQLLRRVLIPAAMPTLLAGIRIGFILTFLATIGGETIASLSGLGHRIVWYAEALNTPHMFAYIVFVILIAVASNTILSWLEKRMSWR